MQTRKLGSTLIDICAYSEIAGNASAEIKIDEIFFEASSVQSFASEQARTDFRWLWMGRYLIEEPEHAFVALEDGDPEQLCGYLVGSLSVPTFHESFDEVAGVLSDELLARKFAALAEALVGKVSSEERAGGLIAPR